MLPMGQTTNAHSFRNRSGQIYADKTNARSSPRRERSRKLGTMVNKTRALAMQATADTRDKARRREEVLAVALKLFSQHEYSAVTIKAIAALH